MNRPVVGGLVGLLLGAAGATGAAFASPDRLAPFIAPTTAQEPQVDNPGMGGVGLPAREPAPNTPTAPTAAVSPTTTTVETTTTTAEPTTTTVETTTAPTTTATPPKPASDVERVVNLVNDARAEAGCEPLTVDERAVRSAQGHSDDMSARDYFSHTTPEGVDFAQRMREAGHPGPGGENIAKGQRTPEAAMKSWMNSDGHRRNILNCDFTTIGVGVATDGWYWTQNFGW